MTLSSWHVHLAVLSQCACAKGAGLRCQTWLIMGLRTVRGTRYLLVRFWLELSCWCLPWGFVQNRVMTGVPHLLRIVLIFSFCKNQGFVESNSPLSWCRVQGWDLADMTSTRCWGCQKLLLTLVSSYANLWDDNWMSYQELHLHVTCPGALTGCRLWWWLPQGMKWWSLAPCPSINWLNQGTSDPVKLNIAVIRSSTKQKRCKERMLEGRKRVFTRSAKWQPYS